MVLVFTGDSWGGGISLGEVQAPRPWRFLREATGQGWRGMSGCRVASGFLGCRGVVEVAGLEEQGRLCPQGLPWCENGERWCGTRVVPQCNVLGLRASPWVSVKNQLLHRSPLPRSSVGCVFPVALCAGFLWLW